MPSTDYRLPITINHRLLHVDSLWRHSPEFALIVFIAVQPPARYPGPIGKGSLFDVTNAGMRGSGAFGREQDPKSAANAQEFIGTGGNDEPVSGLGFVAEDFIQAHRKLNPFISTVVWGWSLSSRNPAISPV